MTYILGDLGRSWSIFRDLGSKGKILLGSRGNYFEGSWEINELFSGIKGAQTPLGGLIYANRKIALALYILEVYDTCELDPVKKYISVSCLCTRLFKKSLFKVQSESTLRSCQKLTICQRQKVWQYSVFESRVVTHPISD